ncbi:hypothetical protein [Thiolinea disciformis]|uniref:hypothetical protein n=1 Tax=Thiolinea disciformis TaxID=125614 RepID=UPI00036D9C78|nr:hypothetical protein [Thiolinea disciformis]
MSDEVRQAYLEGFEGGDLRPERARMVEAYVNGVDGELLDNLALCRIGGFKPKDSDSARTIVWKVFLSHNQNNRKAYAKEREYLRYLQAENKVRSTWDAEEIRQRLQRNVMLAQGEMTFDKLLVANHKGVIKTKVVRVAELNIPAATQALQLLGKNIGMFKDQVEHTGIDGNPIEFVRRVEYVKADHE